MTSQDEQAGRASRALAELLEAAELERLRLVGEVRTHILELERVSYDRDEARGQVAALSEAVGRLRSELESTIALPPGPVNRNWVMNRLPLLADSQSVVSEYRQRIIEEERSRLRRAIRALMETRSWWAVPNFLGEPDVLVLLDPPSKDSTLSTPDPKEEPGDRSEPFVGHRYGGPDDPH